MAKAPVKAAPISILTLPEPIEPIYKRLVSIIKKEREIKPSEYGLISQLASQYYLNQLALNSIVMHGAVIISSSKYGDAQKANPQNQLYDATTTKIIRLSEKLLLTQKEMDILNEPIDAVEEDEISIKERERAKRRSTQ